MFNITTNWNRVRNTVVAMLFVAIFGFVFVSKANSAEWDKKTVVTFSGPVEIPGKVLLAGTYVFKLLDSTSNRNIVQIFDKDEKKLYATMLAIPDYRLQPSDKPVIRFEERPAGSPEAIKAWFYPGDQYGQQFVYPHTRAVELAKQSNQNVLSMANELNQNITTPAKSASEPSVQAMQKTEVTAVKPSGDQIELAQAVSTKPENSNNTSTSGDNHSASTTGAPASTAAQTTEVAVQTHPNRLPQTGSNLPLVSMIGACSLGAALIIDIFRRAL